MLELNNQGFNDEIKDGKGVAIVDFWAPWCGPCKMFAPVFEKLGQELGEKIKFAKVNVDENQELASALGIMSIPTLAIFKDGEEVDRLQGFQSEKQLKEKLQSLI